MVAVQRVAFVGNVASILVRGSIFPIRIRRHRRVHNPV